MKKKGFYNGKSVAFGVLHAVANLRYKIESGDPHGMEKYFTKMGAPDIIVRPHKSCMSSF